MNKKNKIKVDFNKEELLKKIKFFSKRRYDFVLFILSMVIIYMAVNLNSALELIKQKDDSLNKAVMYATYITDSGVIKQYERESFKVYKEKYNVANILSKYLIQSTFTLTNAYKIPTFKNDESLYKSYKPFQNFYNNFIAINKDIATEKNIKSLERVKSDWKQILRWFVIKINNNTLPQILQKKNDSIDFIVWNTKDNYFSIVFKIPIYVKSRTIYGEIKEGLTSALIEAEGYYNLRAKTTLNPYGMKFTHLKITHPVISNAKTNEKRIKQ